MRRLAPAMLLAAPLLASTPALAHPHIFVDAAARIVFDPQGNLARIENRWTFDEAFSSWQTQGLDTDGNGVTSSAEMQELADENLLGLAEYGFYTYAGVGEANVDFAASGKPRFVFENGRSTLTFAVAPRAAYRVAGRLEIAINDPEYYVAITFADAAAVTLVDAPHGCSMHLDPPQTMSDVLAEQLSALPPDVTTLPPDLAAALRGVQGAIVLDCPAGSAGAVPTATEAASPAKSVPAAVAAPAIPFGGPPPEPGLNLPKTGMFGWIAEQQRNFYRAMTGALGQLKADDYAFWVLGTLSFFYGVFHAAGPGHGKVVISSYVLANERQVRRGILLSFAAAMLQSLVAIGFVLVAVAALDLTATAMSEAANWIGIVSYGLVAMLGLWLIARKLFGRGHSLRPPKADLAYRAHAHLHGHGHHHGHHPEGDDGDHDHHHHVVPANDLRGGWREQLGVVLGVGLRPCSGALVVLAFVLSQGVVAAGIVAVLLMGLGTGITVAVLAAVAVGLKAFGQRTSGGAAAIAARLVWWAELLGAVLVFGFGAMLLIASV